MPRVSIVLSPLSYYDLVLLLLLLAGISSVVLAEVYASTQPYDSQQSPRLVLWFGLLYHNVVDVGCGLQL